MSLLSGYTLKETWRGATHGLGPRACRSISAVFSTRRMNAWVLHSPLHVGHREVDCQAPLVRREFDLRGTVDQEQALMSLHASALLRFVCMRAAAFAGARSKIKAITQNHFGNQVVGRTRKAYAEAKIDPIAERYSNQSRGKSGAAVARRHRTRSPDRPNRNIPAPQRPSGSNRS